MTQKKKGNGSGAAIAPVIAGLSRGATYRLSPKLAYEMELYALANSRDKKEILEDALGRLFEADPIQKNLRAAAEVILSERWKE